jgi:hypothetical protein
MRGWLPHVNDALLHLLEKPGDGAAHPQAAALVYIGIEALDLAGPVDLVLDHRTGGSHLLGFARALAVGAVASHIQMRGRHRGKASITWRRVCGRRQAIKRRQVFTSLQVAYEGSELPQADPKGQQTTK